MTMTMAKRKALIEYHNAQLLKIVKSINPDFPLGNGMIAQIKEHKKQLENLGE